MGTLAQGSMLSGSRPHSRSLPMRSRRRTGNWRLSFMRPKIKVQERKRSLRRSERHTMCFRIPGRSRYTTNTVRMVSRAAWEGPEVSRALEECQTLERTTAIPTMATQGLPSHSSSEEQTRLSHFSPEAVQGAWEAWGRRRWTLTWRIFLEVSEAEAVEEASNSLQTTGRSRGSKQEYKTPQLKEKCLSA